MRFALLIGLTFSSLAIAQNADFEPDEDPERCIFVQSVRRIEAIDDSTLAFFMGRDRVYVNLLPRRCRGLARYNRVAYETRGGRLCSTDRVSVIYGGATLDLGLPCPLGEFHLSNEESVELMQQAVEQRGRTSPVRAEPVELPPREDDATEADAEE